MKMRQGFTLVELLVVVGIIALLATAVYVNTRESTEQSRDIQRKADLRMLQNAVELYKQKHGRYPAGCNNVGAWSGQKGTSYQCTDGRSQYIRGHAAGVNFVPDFIPALPSDPRLNGNDSGYMYSTNADGTVYIIKAKNTVESENVNIGDEFQSCDRSNSNTAICDQLSITNNSGSVPNHCGDGNSVFDTSYAVWGGLADETYGFVHPPGAGSHPRAQELTEDVICMIP